MRIIYLFLSLFLIGIVSYGQELVFVKFTDKPNSIAALQTPNNLVSPASFLRKQNQSIVLDERDVNIHQPYIESIKNLTIDVLGFSKWMNGVIVQVTNEQIEQIEQLSFVNNVESFVRNNSEDERIQESQKNLEVLEEYDYGVADSQTQQLNLQELHLENFTGNAIKIAILDAGFISVNTNPGFEKARNENRIHIGYDFVSNSTNVYQGSAHGTAVTSTIIGDLSNYKGTAPNAEVYLFRTENLNSESPLEEVNWVRAAEVADSIGVHILNSSLGYVDFDDSRYNYSHADLNGQSYISRAATIASEKGILVVSSAGNSGNSFWEKINVPADAENILTVGSVTNTGDKSHFSSVGPTADGRIKPEVMAQGSATAIINTSGNAVFSNGTSFSSPIIAGAAACLMEKVPNLKPTQYIQILKDLSHLNTNPNNQLGWGIPDFSNIPENLNIIFLDDFFQVYPNPVTNRLNIETSKNIKSVQIYNVIGELVYDTNSNTSIHYINYLSTGVYIVKVRLENEVEHIKKIIVIHE